ncbi:hypothetical protein AAFF_G00429690 [Aldrovandia affinis]|uniref:Uncharacterized protein n=1 Tax=Aldrovandia affinis TaxID=143900 RepID=A0AAD7S8W8_9TELE|nr:hypothetical protein AAFF_G00429690 [Aldrovandia affinis]
MTAHRRLPRLLVPPPVSTGTQERAGPRGARGSGTGPPSPPRLLFGRGRLRCLLFKAFAVRPVRRGDCSVHVTFAIGIRAGQRVGSHIWHSRPDDFIAGERIPPTPKRCVESIIPFPALPPASRL